MTSTLTDTLSSSPVLHDLPAPRGALVAAGEEKLPTIDPESLDATRPVDLDVCDVCQGSGEVQIGWADGVLVDFDGEPCWGCGGTGQRGAA